MRMERDLPNNITIHHNHIIRGSSAGSMIFLVSCLKDEYRTFEWIYNTAETIRDKYSRVGGIPNMRVIAEKCFGCGLCSVTCPENAISLVEARAADFIPE